MWSVLLVAALGLVNSEGPHTYFEFTRAFDTCDAFGDRPYDGTLKTIWAFHEDDPKSGDDFLQHTNKGSTPIHLKTAEYEAELERDTRIGYVKRPYGPLRYGTRKNSLNSTYYWSGGFDLWDLLGKDGVIVDADHAIHITKWEMAFNNENFRNMHHLNIIPCPQIADCPDCLNPDHFGESGTYGKGGDNPEDTVPKVLNDCWLQTGTAPVMAWVLGTEPQQFPPEVGLKVGGKGGMRYVLLGLHYDIPSYDPPSVKLYGDETPAGWQPERILQDDTGVRYWYTQQLRPNDLGFAWIGINPDRDTFVVPANQPDYVSYALSNPHCWDPLFPESGEVTVLQMLMHGHDQDTKFKIRHVRGGRELEVPAFDPHYNNYYQQWLTKKFTWKKGDQFIIECTIDSTGFQRPLTGGLGTNEQMCIGMFMIYPAFGLANSLIEWTFDETAEEPGRFRSNPGQGLDCTGETYFWPDFVPLPEEKTCLNHKDPNQLGDTTIRSIGYDDIDFSKYEQHRVVDGYELEEGKFNRNTGNGRYHLYWTYHQETDTVDFLVDVETTGWVGFGVSPNGGMIDADVFMMYIDDATGEPFFYDRFAEGEYKPVKDFFQDGYNVRGGQHGAPIWKNVKEIAADPTVTVAASTDMGPYYGILVFLSVVSVLILLFSAAAFYVNYKSRNGGYVPTGTEMT